MNSNDNEIFSISDHIIGENIPSMNILVHRETLQIPERFLPINSKRHILSPSNKRDFLLCLREGGDVCTLSFLAHDTLDKKILEKKVQDLHDDLIAIHDKVTGKAQTFNISEIELEAFYSDIVSIYRQVINTPLWNIEAQVDTQINTIMNTIMLHKITNGIKSVLSDIL